MWLASIDVRFGSGSAEVRLGSAVVRLGSCEVLAEREAGNACVLDATPAKASSAPLSISAVPARSFRPARATLMLTI